MFFDVFPSPDYEFDIRIKFQPFEPVRSKTESTQVTRCVRLSATVSTSSDILLFRNWFFWTIWPWYPSDCFDGPIKGSGLGNQRHIVPFPSQRLRVTLHLAMILNNTDKLVILLNLGFLLYFYSRNKRSSLPLPPGPKKLPLLGNLLDFPTSHEWLKYIEWGKQFSKFSNY